ncbi:hypothetical protein NQ314_016169 [Rhamnusium bicolor]|uniref:Uncharacterized protein n=1 Tax=Rhamnusium bicolor TaxID=1586634 RepID=A0AAV8WWY7_9CUCU|nr:hypothetical protein NQ314_016169 [Rhamnusium bicolor]
MPILLLREDSSTSLSMLVERAQKKSSPLPEYDLQLNNSHLDLILLKNPDRKVNSTSTDEGFESDIDSLSIVSSDNDSFTIEKLSENSSKTTETDSANGSSSSDSDTEIAESKRPETALNNQSALEKPKDDPKSVGSTYTNSHVSLDRIKESYNLVDCICYTDVKCSDILIFVIKSEAFVFKFENVSNLQNFYKNFTTLKAVANQKAYNKNFATKFNLLQRTDQNGVTHIEITREAEPRSFKTEGSSNIISINTPGEIFEKFAKNFDNKIKDVNSRQRAESKYINDIKYNTINSKLGPKAKIITKSNSIENILDLDQYKSNLVNINKNTNLRKIWNSAEDLLDPPKRPERRKKLKGKAPQPPKPKEKQVLKYEPKTLEYGTLNRNKVISENSWTNSVPRLLKKPRSKSETRNFVPMAYRYIDTTQDYPMSYSTTSTHRNFEKHSVPANTRFSQNLHNSYSQNLALSNYLRGDNNSQNIGNRLFGLSPKLRDFSTADENKTESRWGSASEINLRVNKDNNLKSVIKNNRDETSKKKNEKKGNLQCVHYGTGCLM